MDLINFHNDEYIGVLMDYMDVCLEVVRELTTARTKRLLLKALADTMAGYLRVYILPVTRMSYYAGNIKFGKAKRVFDLYEELKIFLRSNGMGWLKPIMQRQLHALPIVISSREAETSPEFLPPTRDNAQLEPCYNLISHPGIYYQCINERVLIKLLQYFILFVRSRRARLSDYAHFG